MAQTKTSSKTGKSGSSRSRSNGTGQSRSSTASRSKSNGNARSKAKSRSTRSRSAGSAGTSRSSGSKSGSQSNANASSNGVAESLKQGASEVGSLVQKAKVPLIASGAALAGVAGALVVSRSGKRHKVLGISMPKNVHVPKPDLSDVKADAKSISSAIVDAADRADRFGQEVSRVANSVREVGKTTNKAAKKV